MKDTEINFGIYLEVEIGLRKHSVDYVDALEDYGRPNYDVMEGAPNLYARFKELVTAINKVGDQ